MFENGKVYTTAEVAKALRVSRRTVHGWVKEGIVRNACPSKLIRIRGEDLNRATAVLAQPETKAERKGRAAATINRIKALGAKVG